MPRSPVLKMGSTTAGSEEPVPLTLQRLEDNEQFIQMCSEHNKKYEESDNDDID